MSDKIGRSFIKTDDIKKLKLQVYNYSLKLKNVTQQLKAAELEIDFLKQRLGE